MSHSNCKEPGTGTGLGPGVLGLYIMPLTVHPTLRPGMAKGTGPGTSGLHTHFPIPGPVQCV